LGRVENGELKLAGVLATADGSSLVRHEIVGDVRKPEDLGEELARILLAIGAD